MYNFHVKKLTVLIALFSLTIYQGALAQMNVQFADTLEKTLIQFANSHNMEGVASAVVFPDGTTWSSATGNYGTNSLHTNLLFDIGSNTKSMISTIILMLEEEGKLSINDTIYKHISPLTNVPSKITLKQLMGHRSGLYNFTEHPDFINDLFANPNSFIHPDSVLSKYVLQTLFQAGVYWYYSNTNYIVLAKVIEAIEGQPLNTVLSNRLFLPNQLNHTYLDTYDSYSLVHTGAYMNPGNYWGTHFVSLQSSAWAAGGVISTPDDFAWWCYKLFRGDVLSSASFNKMKVGTNLSSTGGGIYGLGIESVSYNGRPYLMHGGTTMQNSEMHYSVESDFSVVVMDLDQGFYSETIGLQHALIDVLEYASNQPLSIPENLESMVMKAFPNPSNSTMQIEFPTELQNKEIRIEVYNSMGKLIFQEISRNNKVLLNKADFGTGLFWIKAYSENDLIQTERIIFS